MRGRADSTTLEIVSDEFECRQRIALQEFVSLSDQAVTPDRLLRQIQEKASELVSAHGQNRKVLMTIVEVLTNRAQDEMLLVSQAAAEIGVHVSTIRQAAQSGRVRAEKYDSRWVVRRGDLALLRSRGQR